MVTPRKDNFARLGGQPDPGYLPSVHQVCGTSDFEIGWGYVKQVDIVGDDRWTRRQLLRAE